MKNLSDNDLIALGLKMQEWRTKGGVSVMKKYGKDHFSILGKKSAEKRKNREMVKKLIFGGGGNGGST